MDILGVQSFLIRLKLEVGKKVQLLARLKKFLNVANQLIKQSNRCSNHELFFAEEHTIFKTIFNDTAEKCVKLKNDLSTFWFMSGIEKG